MSGNARSRLGRRLEKLEATIPVRSWDGAGVVRLALTKLSPADRDLLRDDTARRHAYSSEAHRAVWERWEDAFAEAICETGFPVNLTAGDVWL
jgi:hypothetical protein